jgi:3'-phosphoadenosine 5'-phosphosulfate sulfotransferase (PAPS reductase)/FAD synthetase
MSRTVCWISAGAASAVAAKLMATTHDVTLAYCETGAEHPDNARFLADVAAWIGKPVERIRSDTYADTWDVWTKRKYLAGIAGAPCTVELKVAPRLEWQRPSDVHVFGYTADAGDVARANRLRDTYFELRLVFPLIDRGLTKHACLAMLQKAGITLPPMYAMGFQNNNCIPCVKATSPNYWSLIRQQFPAEFNRMVALSRHLDVRLARLGDDRVFIDDIPADQPTTDPIQPSCDFLCYLAEQDLVAA